MRGHTFHPQIVYFGFRLSGTSRAKSGGGWFFGSCWPQVATVSLAGKAGLNATVIMLLKGTQYVGELFGRPVGSISCHSVAAPLRGGFMVTSGYCRRSFTERQNESNEAQDQLRQRQRQASSASTSGSGSVRPVKDRILTFILVFLVLGPCSYPITL